jgi:hypothetical protein
LYDAAAAADDDDDDVPVAVVGEDKSFAFSCAIVVVVFATNK